MCVPIYPKVEVVSNYCYHRVGFIQNLQHIMHCTMIPEFIFTEEKAVLAARVCKTSLCPKSSASPNELLLPLKLGPKVADSLL